MVASGVPVEVVAVGHGADRASSSTSRPKTRLPETYLVTMPLAGRIEPIALTEGAPVAKGQVVAQIVPADLELTSRRPTPWSSGCKVDRGERRHPRRGDRPGTGDRFVESMEETVKAAAASVESGRAKYEYAERNLGRIQKLFTPTPAARTTWSRPSCRK